MVARTLLIALTSLLFFFLIRVFPNGSLLILTALLFGYQVFALIRYINSVNRKVEDFFQIYLSGEITSSSARRHDEDEFSPLYGYFDQVNEKLEQARIRDEIRNNYFKTIVDQTTVGLISFNPDGSVEFINDAAKRIFGLNVLRYLHRLDRVKEGLADMLLELKSNDQRLLSLVLDGELVQLTCRKVMFRTEDRTLHLVSFQNIQPELDEKELESWQKLIRVLTHEIMNSMTPIITLVTTITRLYRNKESGELKGPDGVTLQMIEKTIKGLDLIETRGQGLIHFVQNYRNVTRVPKPDFKLLNVKDMFQGIRLLFEDQAEKSGVSLQVDCHPSLFVNADGKLLEQVLINLVKNAIEALEGVPKGEVTMSAQSVTSQVMIEVSDNGKGIPEDLLENIFVPFFTTKEKGSGIGLSLSRQIIRLHGGTMNVTSVPNVRTTFTIKL